MRKGERKLLKDSIIQYVKENTAKISLEELDTVLTAEAIAGYFQVKRNTVSYYLNQEIGKTFFKINTRPVRFLDKKIFEKNFFTVSKDVYASVNDLLDENKQKNGIQKEEKQEMNFVEEQDVFQNLIGSNGSLKKPIEQMKTSIFYPNTSLPVFLHGPTGSGKSFMARKIYEFKISLILLEIGNLVGIFLSIYYGLYSQLTDPTFMRLDQLITGRLTVARNCFLGAGIPLFGSNIGGKVCGYGIYTQANDGYVTELGIVRTLLEYGPIVFGLFCAFMLIAVWLLYKKGYFGAMVLLEIGFIACGVEAYFPAAYNLKAFVFGLAFYQLMGLFKGKEKEEKRGKAVNASE